MRVWRRGKPKFCGDIKAVIASTQQNKTYSLFSRPNEIFGGLRWHCRLDLFYKLFYLLIILLVSKSVLWLVFCFVCFQSFHGICCRLLRDFYLSPDDENFLGSWRHSTEVVVGKSETETFCCE